MTSSLDDSKFILTSGASIYIDLIRATLSQLVVFGHAISYFNVFVFLHEPNIPWMQNIGVVGFFILSGFVISYTVSRKQKADALYGFSSYFIDRFSRIYCAFIPATIIVIGIDMLSQAIGPSAYRYYSAFNIETFLGNILMLQDFPLLDRLSVECCTSFGSGRPFWTLAVEWWLYMAFGSIVLLLIRKRAVCSVVLVILLIPVPLYNLIGGRGNGLTLYWLYGVLAYYLLRSGYVFRMSQVTKVGIMILVAILTVARTYVAGRTAYDPIFALGLAVMFMYGVSVFSDVRFSRLGEQMIRIFARYSFTLYLVHYSILDFLNAHFDNIDPYLLLAIGFVMSNIIACAVGSYTEGPMTRWTRSKLKNIHLRIYEKQKAA